MSTTFISINTSKRQGANIRQLVSLLQQAKDTAESLKATMETQADGGNFDLVGTESGAQAAEGEILYNLTAGTVTALNAFEVTALLSRLG